jgi:hypothetical protein
MRLQVAFVGILAMFSVSAMAAEKSFPKWSEFKTYSVEQMKAVPDVKVAAGKKMSAKGMSKKTITEVVLMKNSIFAQQGFEFTTPYLKNYFASRSWYKAGGYKAASLSKIDRDNAKMLGGVLAKAAGKDPQRMVASKKHHAKHAHKPKHGNGRAHVANDDYGYGDEEYGYGYEDYGYGEEGYGYGYGEE